jgi:putative ABC transport system permease protein
MGWLTTLDRKLVRDIQRQALQLIAIAAVVACGIACFVAMHGAHASLARSRDAYYAERRFAAVFARVAAAPLQLANELRGVAGVERVDARIVADVSVEVPGLVGLATVRLQSVPDHGRPALNDLQLLEGRWPAAGQLDEVLVHAPFARAHGLAPGATLGALVHGRRHVWRIVGIAISPEHVFQLGRGQLLPDDRRFGVMWATRGALAPALAMEGAWNDAAIALARGADPRAVIAEIDRVLAPYGGRGAHDRDEHPSHRFVRDELAQLEGMAAVVPGIFLAVAAFLLHAVLGRMIRGQREQIAALKALGYGDRAIGAHYGKLVAVVLIVGVAAGLGLGAWIGRGMMALYAPFFQFPRLEFRLDAGLAAHAAAITAAAGVLGAWAAVRSAVRLPPAEAMRPPAPPNYARGLAGRVGRWTWMTPATRLIARHVLQRPGRSALASVGVALAIAIVIAGRFGRDAFEGVLELHYQRAQRHDVELQFTHPLDVAAIAELRRLPGVLQVEPLRTVPVRLRAGARARTVALLGLPAAGALRRVLGADSREVAPPREGLLLTSTLGARLGVGVGDRLEVEVLEGRVRSVWLPVAQLVDEPVGLQAYGELGAVSAWLGESPRVTGALLQVDAAALALLDARWVALPNVAAATRRTASLEAFEATAGELQWISTMILSAFAAVIAVGVVYNGGRIALAERARELASLRVLGFRRSEVTYVLLGELAVQVLLAVPLGVGLGFGLAHLVVQSIDVELFRLPVTVGGGTLALAVGVVAVASVATGLGVRRRLDRLDLIAVLKTRE